MDTVFVLHLRKICFSILYNRFDLSIRFECPDRYDQILDVLPQSICPHILISQPISPCKLHVSVFIHLRVQDLTLPMGKMSYEMSELTSAFI